MTKDFKATKNWTHQTKNFDHINVMTCSLLLSLRIARDIPGWSIDKRLAKPGGVLAKSKEVISKDNDLITTLLLVEAYQELTGTKLVGIHHIQCLHQFGTIRLIDNPGKHQSKSLANRPRN